ncbi:SIMPL domain-containing protein [Thiopseudomonas denitrificans]|uniref:Putative secreted protein n=1 Tax=Thiopseudomonas denitrificans TaxID=1501432 RepID=A0A4R6TXY3_9GAMM|nr:SIMPL domain-containing protein [Thiopseudomonas denitrificans]TDQ34663.1 putative secreted protein [Thiopseudomonas denitrificans]
MKNALAIATLATTSLFATVVMADNNTYNRVSLQAEASTQIPHDLMYVTLYTEDRNSDAASLAQDITRTLNQAISQSKSAPEVKLSMGNRNSSPVYDDKGKKIIAWRERAELRLESTNFAQLSTLTGTLLQNMNMGSMRFGIAESTRQQHEDQLLEQAIAAFNNRAQLATQSLGGKDYRLVNLNLGSQGGYQPPMYARAVMASSAPMAESAPMVEAGNSELKMIANGVIEIRK